MKISKGIVTGLGIAGLLVALPAAGQSSTGSSGSSGSSGSMGGSSGSAGGPSSSSETPSGSAASASRQQITGKVEKVDQTKNQLSLQLKVSDTTQVMKDGQKASLSDIKEGDQVRASFSSTGQVQRIDVMSSGGSAPSTAPGGSSGSSTPPAPGSSGSPGSSGRGY